MKKLMAAMLALALLCAAPALAEATLADAAAALKGASTLDEQLSALYDLSVTYADELEAGGWDIGLSVPLAQELPEAFYPPANLDDAVSGELPAEWLTLKYIALYRKDSYDGYGSYNTLLSSFLARLPAANRAASLSEAQAVLLLREYFSHNSNYTGSAWNRHYSLYVWKVGGDAVWRIGGQTSTPPNAGRGTLHGKEIPMRNLWPIVRDAFYGSAMEATDENGSVMTFEVTGENSCILTGVALAEGVTTLEVPQTVDGLTVTEIGERCFKGNAQIESVSLPRGVTRISQYAFSECENLVRVELPDTLEILGYGAFSESEKLRDIEVPDSVKVIENAAFRCNYDLESMRVPASLRETTGDPYQFIDKVARVVVAEGVEKILYFPGSSSLMCVYLPATLKDIGKLYSWNDRITFYAPTDSYAMQAMTENGRACVPCESEEDMPPTEYVVEGDFEFLIFNGEAALFRWRGDADGFTVPDEAAGCPVTRLLNSCTRGAGASHRQYAILPETVRVLESGALFVGSDMNNTCITHLYVTNPQTVIRGSIPSGTTVHAPEGSLAQQASEENGNPFEPWDGVTMPF